MPITSTAYTWGPYAGNASTTIFNYGQPLQSVNDLSVFLTDNNGIAYAPLVSGVDYQVNGVGNPSSSAWTITYPLNPLVAPLPIGWTLTIDLAVALVTNTNLTTVNTSSGPVIQSAIDRLTLQDLSQMALIENLASPVLTGASQAGAAAGAAAAAAAMAAYAPLASPALTGIPTAPTAATGTNTAQIATTAFANSAAAAFSTAFKNVLLNGGFRVDQRYNGGPATLTAGASNIAYTVDRWYGFCTGANATVQRVAGTQGYLYDLKITGASGNTGVTIGQRTTGDCGWALYQASGTATLQIKASSTSVTSLAWAAYYANASESFGTVTTPTKTQIAAGAWSISSTPNVYTASFSVPSGAQNGIAIEFSTGAFTSGTLLLTAAQCQPGAAATAFEWRPYGEDLLLCQKFFWNFSASSSTTYLPFAPAFVSSSGNVDCLFVLPVTMRAQPTLSYSLTGTGFFGAASVSGGTYTSLNWSSPTSASIPSSTDPLSPADVVVVRIACTTTAGTSGYLTANSSSAPYFQFSAEL